MDLQGDAGATQRSRTGGPLITPAFETVWPDVERRLRALLYRRGLDAASVDDVVQEVALRALAGRVTYTSARDLLRWAGPVACNLHVDLLRQRARLLDGEVDPNRPAAYDVAGEVADRMELQRAFRGIAALRPADREAIMEAVTSERAPRTRKEAVRLAVRRHRARSRLALVMEQLAAWVVGLAWLRRSRTATAAALLVPIAAVPLVLGGITPPRQADRAPERQAAAPATSPVPLPDPPEPRRLRPAARAVPAVRAAVPRGTTARRPAAAKPSEPIVHVEGPGGVGVKAGGDDRQPDDRIVCVEDVPLLPKVCV